MKKSQNKITKNIKMKPKKFLYYELIKIRKYFFYLVLGYYISVTNFFLQK